MRAGRTARWPVGVLALVLAAATTGLVLFLLSDAPSGFLRPDDRELVARGALIYAQQCAGCHGSRLEGEANWQTANADGTLPAPPHDATGHTFHHTDDLLFRLTKFGTQKALGLEDLASNMPAFDGTLSDEDIVAVLSFIKASWPEDIRAQHDQLNRLSEPER